MFRLIRALRDSAHKNLSERNEFTTLKILHWCPFVPLVQAFQNLYSGNNQIHKGVPHGNEI
jgi:hypothetical protein